MSSIIGWMKQGQRCRAARDANPPRSPRTTSQVRARPAGVPVPQETEEHVDPQAEHEQRDALLVLQTHLDVAKGCVDCGHRGDVVGRDQSVPERISEHQGVLLEPDRHGQHPNQDDIASGHPQGEPKFPELYCRYRES